MSDFAEIMDGIRCLQQLSGSAGASAAALALHEDLELEAAEALLARLAEAGFVESGGDGRYRLARTPDEIRVAAVCAALRVSDRGVDPRLTLAHLLDWETQVFAGDAVAVGA